MNANTLPLKQCNSLQNLLLKTQWYAPFTWYKSLFFCLSIVVGLYEPMLKTSIIPGGGDVTINPNSL